jgi:carbonic anhydrase
MDATERLLGNNDAYAREFGAGGLSSPPAMRVAIVACMDARLDPARALGLEEGDAHVIRNAGGSVTDDVIRSLAISQHLLGTEEIMLLHHTDCGMQKFTDDEFAQTLERASGQRPTWRPGSFADAETDVRDSIRLITESPFIVHKDRVRGFMYEVETGRVREVR